MARSPTVSTLLILTLLIVSKVSSAPREEMIPQESNQEKFIETREAELLERHSRRYEKFGESREDEVRHRPPRLVKEPLAEDDSKAVSTKKPTTVAKKNETSEAKDMTESFAYPKDDDDATDSNKTSPIATDNNNKKPGAVEASENKNSSGNETLGAMIIPPKLFPEEGFRNISNATVEEFRKLTHYNTDGEVPDATGNKSINRTNFAVTLPPMLFPKDGVKNISYVTEEEYRKFTHYKIDGEVPDTVANNSSNATKTAVILPPMLFPKEGYRSINNATAEVFRKLTHYKIDGEIPDAMANKSNNTKSSVEVVEIMSTSNSSTVSTTVSPTTAITTEKSTTTTSTTQPSVPTIITTSTTIPKTEPIVTTENSTKSEVITESTMTVVSTEPSKAELKLHTKKAVPMPSGIVALITAIAFAIIAVMAYVGLVAWRRYLEWRYGNRELLVNDFDANDIGNFEL